MSPVNLLDGLVWERCHCSRIVASICLPVVVARTGFPLEGWGGHQGVLCGFRSKAGIRVVPADHKVVDRAESLPSIGDSLSYRGPAKRHANTCEGEQVRSRDFPIASIDLKMQATVGGQGSSSGMGPMFGGGPEGPSLLRAARTGMRLSEPAFSVASPDRAVIGTLLCCLGSFCRIGGRQAFRRVPI